MDITVAVNKCAQRITKATVRDLQECNAIGRRVQETPSLGLILKRGIFDFENYVLVTFGDASFANAESVRSQCGEVVVACRPEHIPQILQGRYDLCTLISWRSATIKRVVRSTLAAEGYAISEAAEQAEWIKQVMEEQQHPHGTRQSLIEKKAELRKSVVYTDNDSLSDTVERDAGKVADRRFRIVVAMLRQMFASNGVAVTMV